MKDSVLFILLIAAVENAAGVQYSNMTLDPASRQILDFKLRHPVSYFLLYFNDDTLINISLRIPSQIQVIVRRIARRTDS